MPITDTTLLRLSPHLFIDATAAGTVLLSGTDGGVAGTTLTSIGSDFAAAGIGPGHVVVVNGEVLEVQSRTSATVLEMSRARVVDADPQIEPTPGSALSFSVLTFERLISDVHEGLLATIGIDADHPTTPLDETSIINIVVFDEMVALAVTTRAYELVSARDPATPSLAQQATHWKQQERDARTRSAIYLDLDGDGEADAARRLDVATFIRR